MHTQVSWDTTYTQPHTENAAILIAETSQKRDLNRRYDIQPFKEMHNLTSAIKASHTLSNVLDIQCEEV